MLVKVNQRFFINNNTGHSERPLDLFAHGKLKGSKFKVKQKTYNLPAIRVFPECCDKTLDLIHDHDWFDANLQVFVDKVINGQ